VVNPENTFFSVKRFIGRKMNEVRDECKQVPYEVVEDAGGNVKIKCPNAGKDFAAEEISAQVGRGRACGARVSGAGRPGLAPGGWAEDAHAVHRRHRQALSASPSPHARAPRRGRPPPRPPASRCCAS
jgi:hypothetical protein